MTYATQTTLQDRYSEEFNAVAALDSDSDQIDVDRVARVIAGAMAEVDSYIGKRYDLPLITPIDPLLEKLTGDIAMYNLPADAMGRTDHQRQRYEDAIKHLDKIAKGNADLRITQQGETETSDSEAAEITSEPRLFKRGTMGNLL